MALKLLGCIQDLLKEVEKWTGKEIRIVSRHDLPVPARLSTDDPCDPCINLLYRSDNEEALPYVVAVACGHILRLYQAPPEQRLLPVSSRRAMAVYLMDCEEEIRRLTYLFGKERMRILVPIWYESTVYQLTTMPPEIMINKWIYDRCPDIRSLQLKALQRQRRDALHSLSPEVRKLTPAPIYRAANIMNYVFFKLLEDHFHLDFVAPYHKTVFIFDGSTLAKLSERLWEDNHMGDRRIIDLWANRLELSQWYEWRPGPGGQNVDKMNPIC